MRSISVQGTLRSARDKLQEVIHVTRAPNFVNVDGVIEIHVVLVKVLRGISILSSKRQSLFDEQRCLLFPIVRRD